MRIIYVLLLVSLCYLVGAKYLPEESASRALLRNVRSTRNDLHDTQETQSIESNDDDDDESGDDNDDDKNDSLERKRQEQIEKLERKRVEEQRKLQEKRAKEDRKRQEMLEKEQRQKEKIEAKFEEEKRKLEEKVEKEKRKRAEKIEKEERKKAETLAKEEQKRQEKIAKEERKQQQQINKKLTSLSEATISSQNVPITSTESEEDMDLEDIWKNYIYEKYGLSSTSTDIEKKAAVNQYMQEELGLNANSTKAEYRQAVLQLVQNRLADQQSPSNSNNSFKNYLSSHVNAIYIQKLQVEIESKIAELENDTIFLQNISLPWVPQAKHTIQQKKTILTSIAQYLSSILPNWITGSNSSSSTNSSNSNTADSSVSTPVSSNIGSVPVSNDGIVSGSMSDSTTINGIPINIDGISSINAGSDITGTTNLLDYNNPELIDSVASSNNPAGTSNTNVASPATPSNSQLNGATVDNNELTISGLGLTGSVTEGFLTNDVASTSDQANNYSPISTGSTVESVVLNDVIDSDPSLVISTGTGASNDSASPSTQSASSNIITTGTEAALSFVSSGTDENLLVPFDTTSTNVEGLDNSNGSASSTSSASPTIIDIPTSDVSVNVSTNNIDLASSTNSQNIDAPQDEVTSSGTETVNTGVLGVLENTNIDTNTVAINPSSNSSETSNISGIIDQSLSGSSNTATAAALDSILGVEHNVAGSTGSANVSELSTPGAGIVSDSISTATDKISANTSPNDMSATIAVGNSINISSGGETSPTVTDVAIESVTNAASLDITTLINNDVIISQGNGVLDVASIATGIVTDNQGDISSPITEAPANKTDIISTVIEASDPSSLTGIINTVENVMNTVSSGTEISTSNPVDTVATATDVLVENAPNEITIINDSLPTITTGGETSTNTNILSDSSVNAASNGIVSSVASSSDYPNGSSNIAVTDVGIATTSESGIESTLSGSTDVINTQEIISEDKITGVIETTTLAAGTNVENTLNTSDSNVASNNMVTVIAIEPVAVNTVDTATITVDTASGTTVASTNVPEAVGIGQENTSAQQITTAPVDANIESAGGIGVVATEQVAVNNIDTASNAVDSATATSVASSNVPEAVATDPQGASAQQITAAPVEINVEGSGGTSFVPTEQVTVNNIDIASNVVDTESATIVASTNAPEAVTPGQENTYTQQITTAPIETNVEATGGTTFVDVTSNINTNTQETIVETTGGLDASVTPISYVPNTVNEATAIESIPNEVAAAGTDDSKNPIGPDSMINTSQIVVTEGIPPASETVLNVANVSSATEKVIVTDPNTELQSTDVEATVGYLGNDINLVTAETASITEAPLTSENNNYTPLIPEEAGASLLEVTQQ